MSTLYRVFLKPEASARPVQRWGGSMAEVRAAKDELMEKHGVKRSGVDHEELEIAFGKAGVLEFLNEHATGG